MRLVANLQCEMEWAGRRLPDPVLARTAALGALLCALAQPGDRVWTPVPVDEERVAALGDDVTLGNGPLDRTGPLLAWGETREVAAARGVGAVGSGADGWVGRLRALEPSSPDLARTVNRRSVGLALAERLALALPGARIIRSVAELQAHVRWGGADASADRRWVVKGMHGAAGRERVRGNGDVLDQSAIQRLLARHTELRFEPWMEIEEEELGAIGLVEHERVSVLGQHVQVVRGGGALARLTPLCADATEPELERVAEAVGRDLHASGYRGPFGIDAYRIREADGAARLHPLGEVNARLTFGFLGRAFAERGGWTPACGESAPTLHLGTAGDLEQARPAAVTPLLLPTAGEPSAAWMEAPETD